jgi:hypothetical protein
MATMGLLRGSCALSFALCACAPLRYVEQEIAVRNDPDAKTLEVLILYDGIQSTPQDKDKNEVAVAEDFVTQVLTKRRIFMIFDWPLILDLEELLRAPLIQDSEAGDAGDALRREWRAIARGVSVRDSGFYMGKTGHVSLYQHLRIADSERFLAAMNQSLHLWIEQNAAEGSFESDTPLFDAETRASWIRMARERKPWLRLEPGELVAEFPMTSACAARVLAGAADLGADEHAAARFLDGLCTSLSSLQVADGRVRLTWKLTGTTLAFRPPKDADYDGALATALKGTDLRSRDAVLEQFEKR